MTQQSPTALGVAVAAGTALIPSGNGYPYVPWLTASENVTLNTADGSNPRIDLIVAYIDLSVVSSSSSNNPNAWALTDVTGTPAGSPSVPNAAAIQAALPNASYPYIILARVAVAAEATTITNANITDVRNRISLPDTSLKFNVYRNAAANSGNGAFATVVFDTENTDPNSNFDTSTGTYTAPYTGPYRFDAAVSFASSSQIIIASLFKNGTEFKRGNRIKANADNATLIVNTELDLTAGDQITIRAFGGATVALEVGEKFTYFSGRCLGRSA